MHPNYVFFRMQKFQQIVILKKYKLFSNQLVFKANIEES